jgi:hypothetical protein
MIRIGVTGHQKMPQRAVRYARQEIRALLSQMNSPFIGITSLAAGADQIFAQEVLRNNGQLWVVIPSADYQSTLSGRDLMAYRGLLAAATDITQLDFDRPSEAAYNAAGRWIVENCDQLVAVWDGLPARGLGGTGDVVAYAKQLSRDVHIVWPRGVIRD